MGSGSWSSNDFATYKSSRKINKNSTVNDIFVDVDDDGNVSARGKIKNTLNPNNFKLRESRDSNEHPASRAIILGVDVTGSMGKLSEEIAKVAIDTLAREIYEKKPVKDPQIMFMAIGDACCDSAPIQMTQFESDIRIAEQFSDIFFEGRGGGNYGESYSLAWYAASRKTDIDCFNKRNEKGFLFTIGDEQNHKSLSIAQVKKFFGDNLETNLTDEELLAEVSRKYEVFHLIVGKAAHGQNPVKYWKELLGERAQVVTDISKIPEIITSTLQVIGGISIDDVLNQWDGTTAVAVKTAIQGLASVKQGSDLVEFVA
jgi:hypothetical protein